MKNKKLIIAGAGEIAAMAYEYFSYDSDYEVVAFCPNEKYIKSSLYLGLPVVPFENIENYYSPSSYYMFIGLSNSNMNKDRERLFLQAKAKGYLFASYISSKAFVWHNVKVGDNCFILENNVLQPFSIVGNNVFMWSGNHLGHRSIIHDNCYITSHVVICGFSEVGSNSFIGVNASISDNIKIGNFNYIAMGAIVNKNTNDYSVYICDHTKKIKVTSLDAFGQA